MDLNRRHTSRFLIFWLMLLPLALWPEYGWVTVPILALVSFVLLGIEEIGVEIEEPFSILALDKLCKDVERHVTDMLAMDGQAMAVAEEAVMGQRQHVAEQMAYSR
jgi:predicted membrane chloride channel (bestrophin family)